MNIRIPTGDECSKHAKMHEDEHRVGYAIWYPQMGGYVCRAVALLNKGWKQYENGSAEGGCIDVYVWHNGEFPFEGEGDYASNSTTAIQNSSSSSARS